MSIMAVGGDPGVAEGRIAGLPVVVDAGALLGGHSEPQQVEGLLAGPVGGGRLMCFPFCRALLGDRGGRPAGLLAGTGQ
ncbi:hypothetical protein GCM10023335_51050 [Streptomyces siamensis]|uniref:Uncharacterized protein n=1 Tax=Streptomyces siamensis TaxID=1274986 RepID=A0ABP9J769_9ACTN